MHYFDRAIAVISVGDFIGSLIKSTIFGAEVIIILSHSATTVEEVLRICESGKNGWSVRSTFGTGLRLALKTGQLGLV